MAAHKFKTGDLVLFQTGFLDRRQASGVYTVVRTLPANAHGELQYQVKNELEPYGRIVQEHQLLRASAPNETPVHPR